MLILCQIFCNTSGPAKASFARTSKKRATTCNDDLAKTKHKICQHVGTTNFCRVHVRIDLFSWSRENFEQANRNCFQSMFFISLGKVICSKGVNWHLVKMMPFSQNPQTPDKVPWQDQNLKKMKKAQKRDLPMAPLPGFKIPKTPDTRQCQLTPFEQITFPWSN